MLMKELLECLREVFGGNLVTSVVLMVLGYHAAIGIAKLISTLRAYRLNLTQLEATKRQLEIVKLSYEIDAIRRLNTLPESDLERSLRSQLAETPAGWKSALREPRILTDLVAKLSKVMAHHSTVRIGVVSFAHLLLRLVPLAFLTLISLFQWVGGPTVHWDNAFPLAALFVLGFGISSILLRASRSAGLADPVGPYSYVLGAIVGGVLYVTGMYPTVL
jgi:hypothetical protein